MPTFTKPRVRIPSAKPSRPPDITFRNRTFTRTSQSNLIGTPFPRPQLVFLGPHSKRGGVPGQWHISRLISTENKKFIREQARLGVKLTIGGAAFTVFILYQGYLLSHELLEREFQTPHDWGYRSRCTYHSAKGLENPRFQGLDVTDYGPVSCVWKKLLERLEDPNIEGAGIKQQIEGGIYIPGAGEAGYDISAKSEAWRTGYFETLMGCAKAAEHLDGKVVDVTRKKIFRPEYVIGPSNPHPKPVPPWQPEAPLEENCVPAFDDPKVFYSKLLTTKGLSSRQQVTAAIAYGEWLDFKGEHQAADEALRWGLDIACAGLDSPTSTIDPRTSIIKVDAPVVTENILHAATAFAVHQAQAANTTLALPILLSVLRARRTAAEDISRTSREPTFAEKYNTANQSDIGAFFTYIRAFASIFSQVPYKALEPSGDLPFRRKVEDDCEEASVMTYLGEILFANGGEQREAGLKMTRDAVHLANLSSQREGSDLELGTKCIKCVDVGLENWKAMVETLKLEAEIASEREGIESPAGGWTRYFRNTPSPSSAADADILAERARSEAESLDHARTESQRNPLRSRIEEKENTKPIWGTWLLYLV